MLLNILRGNFTQSDLITLLLRIPVVLFALSFHEMAHAWAASKMGDNTARAHGRITMNPMKHLDVVGSLSMLLFGVGWAKPVPINPRNFDNYKKGTVLTALAGPLANLILAVIGSLMYSLTVLAVRLIDASAMTVGFFQLISIILSFFAMFEVMNVYLAVFNFIPIPPFDGSRVLYFFLPEKLYFSVMKNERIIMVVILFLLFSGLLDGPLAFVTGHIVSGIDFVIGLVPFL